MGGLWLIFLVEWHVLLSLISCHKIPLCHHISSVDDYLFRYYGTILYLSEASPEALFAVFAYSSSVFSLSASFVFSSLLFYDIYDLVEIFLCKLLSKSPF